MRQVPLPISIEELRVVQFQQGDERDLYAIESNPRVKCFLGTISLPFEEWWEELGRNFPSGWLAVKDGETLAGRVVLSDPGTVPDERHLEIILDTPYWGKNYGRRLAMELVSASFDNLGAKQVSAETHPENCPARALLANLGFKHVGPGATHKGLPRFRRYVATRENITNRSSGRPQAGAT